MIRKANEADLDAIFSLYYEFHEFHARRAPAFLRSMGKPDDCNNKELVETIRKIILGSDSILLVAEDDEELIGLAEVYLRRKGEGNRLVIAHTVGHIQSVIVHEARRKEGWGKRLVDAAQTWAREHGAEFLELELWDFPDGPLGFYEELGFHTLKRTMIKDLTYKWAPTFT